MTSKLLPCPFCNSEATLENHRLIWCVRCSKCSACVLGERAPEPHGDGESSDEVQDAQAQKMSEATDWAHYEKTAIDAWNNRAPLSPDHSGGGAGMVLPEGFMICERSIWTEQQVESAAKCITLLKDVPGMTARDLALAAMDAGQCNAPDINLADFPCLDKVKELNQ